MSWEDEALKAAQDCLQNGFALYNFQVTYVNHEPRIQVYLDKLIDELAKGKAMENILRGQL